MSKRFAFLILISFAAGLLSGCGNDTELHNDEHTEYTDAVKLTEESIKQIGLRTEITSLKPLSGFMSIPAKVLADQDKEAYVGSLIQGRVSKVFVKAGDYVKKGDELMQVEGLEVGVIKAAYLTAKASLEYLKQNYERQKSLIEQNAGSQKSFNEARAEYEKALAEYTAEDKKIHSIGLDDDDIINETRDEHTSGTLPVKAPINGIVVERNVVIGQQVDGSTNAFRIIDISSVWIDGQIYEKDINRISKQTNAVFTMASSSNDRFNGKISYIGQTIDEASRTITVRGEFNNPDGRLKPQMFGEMRIPVGEKSSAILIPAESVIKIDNADYVFVQNGAEFEKRAVITGSTDNELVEIKEGLKENEVVVTKGAFFLKSELLKGEIEENEH